MLKQNKAKFTKCNIPLWHSKGYTGKGIKVGYLEGANVNAPFLHGKVYNPFNVSYDKHGEQGLDVLHQVAPDADLYCLPAGRKVSKGKVSGKLVEQSIPFAINEGISIIGASFDGTNNPELNETLKQTDIIFVTSAGNEGADGGTKFARSGAWVSVGALGLDLYGEPYLKSYSSRDECVDFAMFSGLYVHEGMDTVKVEGTSFAQPMLSGIMALVQQFFVERTGQRLSKSKMYQFLQDHSVDLGKEGRDTEHGHGLVVLPNPDEINISKYTRAIDMEDIKGHWAEEHIRKVLEEGIFTGYPDGTFRPDANITRAEVATILARLITK